MVALLVGALLSADASSLPRLIVPNARDLTVKTRRIPEGSGPSETGITYFKGARQRHDLFVETRSPQSVRIKTGPSEIVQCDRRRRLTLDKEFQTYAYRPILDPAAPVDRARDAAASRAGRSDGPEVLVTIDSHEQPERRQVGSYTARRVVTTTVVDPAPGATMRASTIVRDGWYIDGLPSSACVDGDDSSRLALATVDSADTPTDRVTVKWLRTAPLGFAIEETDRRSSPDSPVARTTRLELLDFSEAPLDSGLFEPPAGYRPALPTLTGGFDLKRPDTWWNRLEQYWSAALERLEHRLQRVEQY